ncbi:MAG: hypothetical protein K0Q52_38 [Microbacterium sp.]|jgi:phenylacetic acid degradation operon negative regulatory protein|nr:hypothetical protein [Microbacterium sp.]
MKPRAVILDIFGDYLRYAGSEVRAGDLTVLLGALGVEPPTVRVTLSRLSAEGWFTRRRAGRETMYRLGDEIREVLDDGRTRLFASYPEDWDGWWTEVVFQMPEGDRATRDRLKKRVAWAGFGALSASTWISPRASREEARTLASEFPAVTVDVLVMRTDDQALDRDLTRRCWDLDALNTDYTRFISEHEGLARRMASLDGPEAFAARTELISTYRHFPFRDPWLPRALRPQGWRGAEAHALFLEIHEALAPASNRYVSSVVGEDIRVSTLTAKNM